MAPPRGRKRKSNDDAPGMANQMVATKTGSPSESPAKRRKIGVTLAQKQALIDNLQLEVTERARKLRAQYNLQAQGLRTRIEIRVNRIPMALRKVKMGELLRKHSTTDDPAPKPTPAAAMSARPPPVPEKDYRPARPVAHGRASPAPAATRAGPGRLPKRTSDDMIAGGDKENQDISNIDNPKKRLRGHPGVPRHPPNPAQVLSPTSSNSRLNAARDRDRAAAPPASPPKSLIARPVSPMKQQQQQQQAGGSTSLLGNMVEKARSTRAAAAATRKATTSSTASSAAGATTTTTTTTAATRTRRGATATSKTTAAATTRAARRVSGTSESSDGSTATVVRKTGRAAAAAATGAHTAAAAAAARTTTKTAATAAPTPAAKRTMMGTLKKGVTGGATRKAAPAAKTAAQPGAATTRSGRVLRKRAE